MRLLLCTLMCVLAPLGPSYALTISAVPASTVSVAPFPLAPFGNAGIDRLVSNAPILMSQGIITFGGNAGLYDGNVGGVVASPLSGSNYLAAEPGGPVTFSFSAPQTSFQLLWGSIDAYNTLTFVGSTGSAVSITGADVQAAGGPNNAAAYVTISGLGAFNKVIASSSQPAFEFLPNVAVPEPGTLALIGAGLGGLVWLRRRA